MSLFDDLEKLTGGEFIDVTIATAFVNAGRLGSTNSLLWMLAQRRFAFPRVEATRRNPPK